MRQARRGRNAKENNLVEIGQVDAKLFFGKENEISQILEEKKVLRPKSSKNWTDGNTLSKSAFYYTT